MIFLRLCCVRMYAAFCHERRYIGRTLTGRAYIWGRESRQVKSAKNLTVDRNSFTESRCSEQRTGITKKCAYARFYEMPHGFVKSIPLTYEEGIDRRVSSRFEQNRFLHQTAQRMRWRAYPLRCFHNEKLEVFMNVRNEIKAQIVRAGFTMQEVVDRLADEYDWSDSVSNLSAKLQRESIRYKEVVELADVLDCDIVWVKRGDRR